MTKADIWMPFYVSDYLSDTMHLTAAEHGAYLMLILHYWKSGPIPDDDARLALITRLGDAWSNASSTLRAFFKQCDGMLVHKRIDRERLDAISNKDRNQARAQAAANKRWAKHAPSNATSITQAMLNECPSPSPSPTPVKKNTNTVAPPDGVALSVWQDFLKTRKTKVTETALNGIMREAEKAGITLESALNECCARGWQSFKADWVNKAQSTNETAYQRSMREKWETVTGRNSTPTEVYDVTPIALD